EATEPQPRIFVDTGEDRGVNDVCREYFRQEPSVRCLSGGICGGGWIDVDSGSVAVQGESRITSAPATGMAVAGLLADAVRAIVCPLSSDMPYDSGSLGWMQIDSDTSHSICEGPVVVVGVGARGVSTAAILAALGCRLALVDFDSVEN